MNVISFGIAGLRRGKSFARVCGALGQARVTALYDTDTARVKEAAEEIGAVAYLDWPSFLESDCDAVVVASPAPFHAQQAIDVLGAGKHVLSEVPACCTLSEAASLAAAANSSDRVYMMAENCRYLDEIELLYRLHRDRRFGHIYFAEGEYLHDCRELWFDNEGRLTWRGQGLYGVYCTHSLGPILYITGERVTAVSALAVAPGLLHPTLPLPTMHILHMTTTSDLVIRARIDAVSPRPHQRLYYLLQGTDGSYEAWRGFGDESKVWLADEHGPSGWTGDTGAQWHALGEQAARYIPDRLAAPREASAGGHGSSEYWLVQDFLAAVRGEIEPPINLHRALEYTLPGVRASESAANGGAWIDVPDSIELLNTKAS